MTTQLPQSLDTLAGRTYSQTFLPLFIPRAPTSFDIDGWKVGQRWINRSFTQTATIFGATQANPAVISAINGFIVGQLVTISGVSGMTELNTNTFEIIAANGISFTINTDSSGFGAYIGGGVATVTNDHEYILNGFHSFNGVVKADWVLLSAGSGGGGGGTVDTLTGDDGVVVVPDASGNINVLGQTPANVSGIRTSGTLNDLNITMFSPFQGDFEFRGVTGATRTLSVTNPNNTAGSASNQLISVGGALAGDPFQTFTVTGATSWSQGIDNSNADSFVLSNSTALGTTDVIITETNGNLTNILGGLFVIRSNPGARNTIGVRNTSAVAGSSATLALNAEPNSGDTYILFDVGEGSPQASVFGADSSDSNAVVLQVNPISLVGPMDGTTVWRMTVGVAGTGVGVRTMPFQPSFLVSLTTASAAVTGDGTVYTFGTQGGGATTNFFDQNTNLSLPAGVVTFTAPVTGKYWFHSEIQLGGIAAHTSAALNIVTTSRTFFGNTFNPGAVKNAGNITGVYCTAYADMTAGQTAIVQVGVSGGALTITANGGAGPSTVSWFQGALIA